MTSSGTPRPDDRLPARPQAARRILSGLSVHARSHLGGQLQTYYADVLDSTIPERFRILIRDLDASLADREGADAAAFRRGLTDAAPLLRAFALSLAVNAADADDLVQETLLRAWANQHRFTPGTNLHAWLCTILKNQFFSQVRRRRREVEDPDGEIAKQSMVLPDQEHGIDLEKVWKAMAKLPLSQREALLLVAAQGLTYEAAATLMGCEVGTAKSRVSRGRRGLAERLNMTVKLGLAGLVAILDTRVWIRADLSSHLSLAA